MILISTGSSGLIVAINGILSIAIVQFANIEIYSTTTAYHTSIAKKLGVAQFVNTALISLIVNLTVYGNRLFVNGGLVAGKNLNYKYKKITIIFAYFSYLKS